MIAGVIGDAEIAVAAVGEVSAAEEAGRYKVAAMELLCISP